MVNYRRIYIPGGTYFFTVTLRDRKSKALTENIDLLYQTMKDVKKIMPYKVIAYVILPDHLHTIWKLPEADSNYSERWKKIKGKFSKILEKQGLEIYKNDRAEYSLWQRRFWEHTIRNSQDLTKIIEYIHYNPIKHQLVRKLIDWPYSSFHHYVKMRLFDKNWGS